MTSQLALGAARGEERLLIVSNRGPFEVQPGGGESTARMVPASGGVATALRTSAASFPSTWLSSWTDEDRPNSGAPATEAEDEPFQSCRFVTSDRQSYGLFYNVFSNQVLWLLQHELPWPEDVTEAAILDAWVNGYQEVNQDFAEAVIREAASASHRAVMFHDYHLYLAPLFVRDALPSLRLNHFVHIPWPPAEAWLRLDTSIVASICTGLLANDAVLFQTLVSATNFLETCLAVLPNAFVDFDAGTIMCGRRVTRVGVNPISVDPEELALASRTALFRSYQAALQPRLGERLLVRVDRLDPSKNIPVGFEAYSRLLEDNPQLRGRVSFVAMLVPTRQAVPLYRNLERDTMDLVERINARYGTASWQPIRVFYENNRCRALAAMSVADVLLVNPVADGMNLVAKEGPLVSERNLVLVLSRTAGAYHELARGAIGVDPYDLDGTEAALLRALTMPASERRARAKALREAILARDLRAWFEGLLEEIPPEYASNAGGPGETRGWHASHLHGHVRSTSPAALAKDARLGECRASEP